MVDLSSLAFIDAAGIAALALAQGSLAACGRRMRLRGAHGLMRRLFEVGDAGHLLED